VDPTAIGPSGHARRFRPRRLCLRRAYRAISRSNVQFGKLVTSILTIEHFSHRRQNVVGNGSFARGCCTCSWRHGWFCLVAGRISNGFTLGHWSRRHRLLRSARWYRWGLVWRRCSWRFAGPRDAFTNLGLAAAL